jgi:hypothetical protein
MRGVERGESAVGLVSHLSVEFLGGIDLLNFSSLGLMN